MTGAKGLYGRRDFLTRTMAGAGFLALGGLGSLGLADCSGTQAGSTGTGTPKRGGNLIVGVNSEIDGFLPAVSHWDNSGYDYANAVFDSLTRVAADGTAKPYLAQSVTPNADMTKWTVTLRSGVKFHDGSPLTAEVLLANFKALKSSALTGPVLTPISGAAVTGPLSVTYTADEPLVAFASYLSTQVGFVVALSQLSNPDGSSHPVGTGPFKFVSWVPNDHLSLTRNPHYWRAGLPYLDTITYHPISADTSRESSLRSNTVDLIVTRDAQTIADLRGQSGYDVVRDQRPPTTMSDMDFIILNCAVPPTNDLTVRQALAYATNGPELVRLFGAGIAEADTSPFPPGSPYRAADNGYPAYDLNKAKQLVSQAAPNHGGQISLSLGTITDPRLAEVVQAIQSMWQAAGFKVNVTQTEQVTYIDGLVLGSFQADTDEQFTAPDPDINYVWWSDTTVAPPGKIALNFARNKDSALEAALQKGRTSSDPATRAAAYQKVDKLLAADLPYLWYARATWSLIGRSGVQNVGSATLPDGSAALAFTGGGFTPTEIWVSG